MCKKSTLKEAQPFPRDSKKKRDVILKTYSRERLKVIGEILAVVEYDGQVS